MECYILIKWFYIILEFLCRFIFFPDKREKKKINDSISNNVLVSHSWNYSWMEVLTKKDVILAFWWEAKIPFLPLALLLTTPIYIFRRIQSSEKVPDWQHWKLRVSVYLQAAAFCTATVC